MPPPPAPVDSTAKSYPEVSSAAVRPDFDDGDALGSSRPAGSRSIGQNNSSIKKFFPTDDDDETERISDSASVHNAARSKTEDPIGDEIERALDRNDELTTQSSEQLYPLIQDYTDISAARHRTAPSSPRHYPPPSPVRSDLPPRKDISNDEQRATPPWPSQIADGEGMDTARPSTPSRSSRNELYAIINQVGEGTFGKVYKARNTVTKLHVALKRIRMEVERDGFPVTAMREIKLLQSLRHENIVRLYEMMVSEGRDYDF
jgi:CTD kinase subunit alpha